MTNGKALRLSTKLLDHRSGYSPTDLFILQVRKVISLRGKPGLLFDYEVEKLIEEIEYLSGKVNEYSKGRAYK